MDTVQPMVTLGCDVPKVGRKKTYSKKHPKKEIQLKNTEKKTLKNVLKKVPKFKSTKKTLFKLLKSKFTQKSASTQSKSL